MIKLSDAILEKSGSPQQDQDEDEQVTLKRLGKSIKKFVSRKVPMTEFTKWLDEMNRGLSKMGFMITYKDMMDDMNTKFVKCICENTPEKLLAYRLAMRLTHGYDEEPVVTK